MRHALFLVVCTSLAVSASRANAESPAPAPRILNNLVYELLSTPDASTEAYAFTNPRDGWVFVSFSGTGNGSSGVLAFLDAGNEPLVWRKNPDTAALESMRYLAAGKHVVRLKAVAENDKVSGRLDVRAVPEIAYCYYPTNPHIGEYGPYDWGYMTQHVLSHVNTLITRSAVPKDEFDSWLQEGRHWIANASLPGLSEPEPPSADDVYIAWASNVCVKEAGYSGLMVDEFLDSSVGHYAAWSEAVQRLIALPEFKGKTFYAWCGDIYKTPQGLEFGRMLFDKGHAFSFERYLAERPTAKQAAAKINGDLNNRFVEWKASIPGVEKRMVMCLGYLSALPETLNTNPSVDYHVFLDMQFHFLANEPVFKDLYGIMEYMADYADEESLRYAHKLFRHYCIEGKRSRLNNDPYCLPHITNPDFADGLDGWQIEPAREGSIATGKMDGFSWLEGRYPRTRMGDTFCSMTRSSEKPNRVCQKIKRLTPGKLYSVKAISGDLDQLEKVHELPFSIEVQGAEMLDEYRLKFTCPTCYGHYVEPYSKDRCPRFDFHRVVFRARTQKAELIISDWSGPNEPGGAEGQRTAFNFVEVQPFHEP